MPSDGCAREDGRAATSQADCDNPTCAYGYDSRAGMDHWFDVTEFDTDDVTEWGYCSRKCMLEHQQEVLQA